MRLRFPCQPVTEGAQHFTALNGVAFQAALSRPKGTDHSQAFIVSLDL
jgi:hypothetical protein